MIREHPFRVLGVTLLVAAALFALAAPGKRATHGAWYYISAVGWYGFLLTGLVFVTLTIVAVVSAVTRRRRANNA